MSSALSIGLYAKTELPAGGTLVSSFQAGQNINFWSGNYEGQPVGSLQEVPVDHPDFDTALRIHVSNPSGNFWTGGGRLAINTTASTGDVGLVRVYIRTIHTHAETGAAVSTVFVQGPENEKSIVRSITSDLEWKEYLIPFTFIEDYALGEVTLQFGIGAGSHEQTYEIGGFELHYYGTNLSVDDLPETKLSYHGREANADWRDEAANRIETHRKGNFTIRVVDANDLPVPNATLDIEMTRHAFQFGSAFATADILDESQNGILMREKMVELFNSGGPFNHLKWRAWAGDWGSANWSHQRAFDALKWMTDNGLDMRGHVLVWPSGRHLPKVVENLIPENPANTDPAVKQMALDHIDSVTSTTSEWVSEWDVVNEPYDNHDLMDAFGNEVMVDWFNQARANLPTQDLYLNDYNILSDNKAHQQHYEDTIQFLLDNEAPINGMGMQGHMGSSPTSVYSLNTVLERYTDAFPELKVRVTEFTIASDDEDLKADYTRDFYTMLFSHPEVVGVQLWGFKSNDPEEGGLFYNHDWSETPALAVYKDLVFDQWWSRFNANANVDGSFQERAYFGQYKATVSHEGGSEDFQFSINPNTDTITLKLASAQSVTYPNYSDWAAVHFSQAQLDAGLVTGETHDADADGWSNFLEYAFGLEQGQLDAGLLQRSSIALEDQVLSLGFKLTRGVADVSYQLERSTDLLNWAPQGAPKLVSLSDDYSEMAFEVHQGLEPGNLTFYRLVPIDGSPQ